MGSHLTGWKGFLFGVALALSLTGAAVAGYNFVEWGGAIAGTWNSQTVSLDAGPSYVLGKLPLANIDASAGTSGQVLTANGGATAPSFQDAGSQLSGTSGSIGGGLLSIGACSSGTASVPGATTAMTAVSSPVTYPGDGSDWKAYVSGAGVVTVKVCAIIALVPAASTFNVRVIK